MLSLLAIASSSGLLVSLVAFNLEVAAMYGLVALVIGLIAWSKYSEPAPSDPYAFRHGGTPDALTSAGPEPVVAHEAVATPPVREQV